MKLFKGKVILLLLFSILIMLVTACRDELLYDDFRLPEEGLPATVSLKVKVAEETFGTRFAGFIPGDTETSRIGHVWIGIFNANTGELITTAEQGESQVANHVDNGTIKFENIPLSSGTCYIVGVTNADSNQGVIIEDSGNVENSKDNLLTILRNINTWEEFKKISFLMSNPESVSRVSANFVMCGAYTEAGDSHSMDFLWDEEGKPQPVYIYPDKNNLPGRVHLQRLDAYVKFVIKPAPELPITITPVSWQVKNLPSVSFLQERKGSCDFEGNIVINAADTKKTGVLWKDYGTFENFYNNSQVYLANTFNKDRDDTDHRLTGSYSFDFYQLENKHTGIITSGASDSNGNNVYNEREREFKSEENGANTGWYKSLVKNPGSSTPSSEPSLRNNNATFVEIRVQVEYFYEQGDENYTPVNPDNHDETKTLIQRVANAVYTVHLGYVKYNGGSPDVNDFNCFRNTATTYNITIYGAEDIRIEAQEGENFMELESGAEGTVTDLEEDLIPLDCHYSVFNIKLSDNARKDLTWRIRAPYGEEYIDMVSGPNLEGYSSPYITNLGDGTHQKELDALPQNQFYNWVQIVPTDGPNVIAKYPGDPRLKNRTDLPSDYTEIIPSQGEVNGVWYLEDLRDTEKFKHHLNTTNDKTIEYYYTVFIDEYVYEYELDKTKSSLTGIDVVTNNWRDYVNRDYRKLWIRLGTPNLSHDGESIYSQSLYMVTQESIQTFYNNSAISGFGMEHINETYNGIKYQEDTNGKSYSANGRMNMKNYAATFTKEDLNNIIFKNNFQGGLAPGTLTEQNQNVTYYINAHDHHHMAGGLARNRDLNNNGKIDDFEIRWYVPVIDTYLRMVLGTVSLKTPLFNLLDYSPGDIPAGGGRVFTHYSSSDNQMIWAEELAAVSIINGYGAESGNMRCIRNLGESMSATITDTNNVQTAYEYDEGKRVVSMNYYRTAALRPETQDNLTSHFVGEILSYPARRFKVAKGFVTQDNYEPLSTSENYIYLNKVGDNINSVAPFPNNDADTRKKWEATINDNIIAGGYYENPDKSDKGTWRLPNINELAILTFLGLLPDNMGFISCTREYFSSRDYLYMGVNYVHEITAAPWEPVYVICVKDIIE